jgi:transposase, IS30 family
MSYVHLTPTERGHVQALLKEGKSKRYIADSLGRHRSTIGREVKRNVTRTGYDGEKAHRRYRQCRTACRPEKKLNHPALWNYVLDKIPTGWTPEEIAGRLPVDYPEDLHMRISHEALYQNIYGDERLHCLIEHLPQSRPKRRKRGQGKTRRGPAIPNRTGIEQRPKEVDDRSRYGDWEGDTIVGANQQGFVATLVERKSLRLTARKTRTKQADEVAQAVVDALSDLPASWLKTLTFDNGTEFAQHEQMAQSLPLRIYFAMPYSSYQRGTNENTNGLLRRYLPKGTDFRELTQDRLDQIVQELNDRPRKKLGYLTPNEVFQQQRQLALEALKGSVHAP